MFKLKKEKKPISFTIYNIVFLAVYLSLFLISSFTIYFGYIPLPTTTLTYLPIIVIVATFHLGMKGGIFSGFGFGFSSWIAAMIVGAVAYQYIDISILPRFILGILVAIIYKLIRGDKKIKLWKFILLTTLAPILNIVLVLSARYLHHSISPLKGVLPVKEWIITHPFNISLEPTIGLVLGLLLYPLIKYLRKSYLQKQNYLYSDTPSHVIKGRRDKGFLTFAYVFLTILIGFFVYSVVNIYNSVNIQNETKAQSNIKYNWTEQYDKPLGEYFVEKNIFLQQSMELSNFLKQVDNRLFKNNGDESVNLNDLNTSTSENFKNELEKIKTILIDLKRELNFDENAYEKVEEENLKLRKEFNIKYIGNKHVVNLFVYENQKIFSNEIYTKIADLKINLKNSIKKYIEILSNFNEDDLMKIFNETERELNNFVLVLEKNQLWFKKALQDLFYEKFNFFAIK
ncbi:ECF transporter S component [Mycoplasmopsis columbina]|uniref:ECF transporter S component n=1 Tax=Mycoplasmopsis columbina TaxID=114881 RepID=UPI00068E950B|nr:ECF transporter S component [Mycoplasmopsis columbina]VEU76655.1 Predicted membrane protein [Mycoplasmopsis columbina]